MRTSAGRLPFSDEVLLQLAGCRSRGGVWPVRAAVAAAMPGGVALVLHVRLHADDGHHVPMGADAQAGDEHALDPLGQQAAVGDIAGQGLAVRRPEHEHRMDREAVRVEVAAGPHDRIGERAVEVDVHRREEEIAHDLPSLAGVDELPEVVAIRELLAGGQERLPGVDHVEVVDEGVIRVRVAGAGFPVGQTRPLDGDVLAAGVDAFGSGGGGDRRAAGGVHDRLGQDHPAAVRRGHHDSLDLVALDEGPAAEDAVPDVGAGLAKLPPVPFDLDLAVPRGRSCPGPSPLSSGHSLIESPS